MSMWLKMAMIKEFPRWATDAVRTLEPSEAEKDVGWEFKEKPPARWMNWIHNATYTWIKYFWNSFLSNWFACESSGGFPTQSVIYHPVVGWFGAVSAGNIFRSNDGCRWESAFAPTANPSVVGIGMDSIRVIFGLTDTTLDYTANGTSKTNIDPGVIGEVLVITTKYPSDDYIIIGTDAGEVRFSTSVVGAWNTPTTPPPGIGATDVVGIVHISGSTWILLDQNGKTYISTDDGDNWAITSIIPGVALQTAYWLAYDADNDVLIACGESPANEPVLIYSDSTVLSWVLGTLSFFDPTWETLAIARHVYHCGDHSWVAVADGASGLSDQVLISLDDGVTWFLAARHRSGALNSYGSWLACDGRQLLMGLEIQDIMYRTNTLPTAM